MHDIILGEQNYNPKRPNYKSTMQTRVSTPTTAEEEVEGGGS